MIVENFDQLLGVMKDKKTYIYQSKKSTSLHFTITAVQSEMHADSPFELVLGYTRTMMGFLLFNPTPTNIGMIGLGGGSLPKYCYAYLPTSQIEVAEISAEVIALREHFFIPKDNSRFKVICIDGADFVRAKPHQFDVLIIDGFGESGQPEQLSTHDFYNDCFHSLTADGVMVANFLTYDLNNAIVIERIFDIFEGEVVIVNAQDSFNKIVFAFKGCMKDVANDVLLSRLKSLAPQHPVKLAKTTQSIILKRRASHHRKLRSELFDDCR
jgi:spermidine synthase